MIAAAIVCATAMSYGAVANWSASGIYDWGDINLAEPTYEVMANDYATYLVIASAEFGVAEAQEALAGGDLKWLTDGSVKVNASTGAMAAGYAEGTTPDWFGNDEAVNAFIVVFNGESAASADHAFVSELATEATGGEGQAASFSFDFSETAYDPAAWTATTAAPEPTTGLLMLIGMAGLALRRRRA